MSPVFEERISNEYQISIADAHLRVQAAGLKVPTQSNWRVDVPGGRVQRLVNSAGKGMYFFFPSARSEKA